MFNIEKRLDILVNNFGNNEVIKDKTIFDTSYENYINIFESNISSIFISCQSFSNILKNNNFPESIINISSIGSLNLDVARIAYSTSKATINSLTQNIACQVGAFNIRCNTILPWLIQTDAVKIIYLSHLLNYLSMCLIKSFG